MKRLELVAFLILFSFLISFAQSPIGLWKNIDDEDGEAKSHIEVYESNDMLYGKVVKLLPNATTTHATNCKGEEKTIPLLGMIIMRDLKKSGDSWDDGKILDPRKCKEYKCKIELHDPNTLHVRGYIGAPIFGKTHVWYRVE